MRTELHVLSGTSLCESFRLLPGIHRLGSSAAADLLLATRDAPADVARVDVSPEGDVTIRALEDVPVRRAGQAGEAALELPLRCGETIEAAGLRLLLLVHPSVHDVRRESATEVPETAPSSTFRAPPRETLVLRITTERSVRTYRLDEPQVTLGRGPPNTVAFTHTEVSRTHARVTRRPDGPWIEDMGSAHGTFLNGHRITAAAWPLGGRVHLSSANDAPLLELLPLADALTEVGSDEALIPLRGRSPAMIALRAKIERYGRQDEHVLIYGETGTGKELVAGAIAHLRGPDKPFIAVNCGAILETLIAGQLFGHKKGAFTGAHTDQAGDFEAARNGTLFLDEIGELPLGLQAHFLRVLEAGEVRRLGEHQTRKVHARVVAATHRDLRAMVADGSFREDLFHRLSFLALEVPPLRARLEDIPTLARQALAARVGRSADKTLSDGALDKLCSYHWPGNVRELFHAVGRAALDTDGLIIPAEAIAFAAVGSAVAGHAPSSIRPEGLDNLPAYKAALERAQCERALAETRGRITAAARILGMSVSAFRRCLARHGLQPFDF